MRKYLILTLVSLLFVVDSKAQVEITSAGTSTAYTLNVPGVFPLRNGIQVTFKAHTACSATATMNVSGTGALPIRKDGNTSALVGGDIKSGQIVTLAYDGSNWQMMSPSGNAVSVPSTYWDPNGSDIYNNNGGNVGIGTSIPSSKLEVQSNATGISDALFLSNTTSADNYGARLAFRSQFITTPWTTGEISGIVSNGNTQGSLLFNVMNNRATSSMIEAMRITGNGRVGIGTTNPAENLQISNANNSNISLIGSASLSNKLYFGSTAFAYLGAVEYNNNNNSMNFWTNNTPNRLYIDANGNVGINNSSPGRRLDVIGDARISSLVGPGTVIADASGNLSVAAGTTITGSGTNNYLARWTPSGSQLGIGATYDDGTNVGIGTPVPAKASGANKYLTVSATDIGTTNASASLEMVGNAAALNSMASRVDFLGVTPVTNVIYTRARIEARTGNGATGHGQLVFYTFNGTLNEAMRIRESGHIGIGGSGVVGSPLSVGTSNQFQVDANGNLIRINNVTLSWPAANGSGFLSNNGSGTLSWSTAGVLAGGTTNYVPKWSSANSLSSTSLIFDNGTSVGINTAAPSASSKLHIVGAGNGSTLNVDDNGLTNGSVLYLASNSTAGTASNSSRMISIARSGANVNASHTAYGLQSIVTNTGTTNTNVAGYFSASGGVNDYAIIVPNGGGRVGLGISSPLFALHAETSVEDRTAYFYNSTNTTNTTFAVYGGAYGAGSGEKRGGSFEAVNGTGTNIALRAYAAGATNNYAFISPPGGGRVGIGTTAPLSLVHMEIPSTDAVNAIGLTVTNNYTGASNKYGIDVNVDGAGSGVKYGINSSIVGLAGDASSIYGYQVAMTPNGTGTSYGVYSTQSSVGTGSRYGMFSSILHSSSSTSTSYGYYSTMSKPAGATGNIFGTYLNTSHGGTGTAYGVYTLNETYNYFSGDVGIGTNAPAYQLHLSLNSAAKPTSNAWTVVSDARLKTNIRPYEAGLADLMKIKPVWFTYTGEANMPKETGVGIIAQELQEVAPYMVSEWTYVPNVDPTKEDVTKKEEKKYLAVDNGAMTYMLINAVKEQQAQIEELKKQLEAQKKKIEAFEKK
ncbi:MAG: tail fiber domain-containing protein [Bacteroidetes bacterium]|nr:tail fiber domain-containing protein [Bacteroidota bacterium]